MTGGEPSANAYVHHSGRVRRGDDGGKCARCGGAWPSRPADAIGTGYAIMDLGNGPVSVCYECCALYDKEWMHEYGRITLYLLHTAITNWPGTLVFDVFDWSHSKHNWGLTRTDVWFPFENEIWHGVNIGTSQLVHCKRTKKKM